MTAKWKRSSLVRWLSSSTTHEKYLKASWLTNLIERYPIHTGRFHRYCGHCACLQSIGELLEITRNCAEEAADGQEIALRRRIPKGHQPAGANQYLAREYRKGWGPQSA